MLEIKKNNYGPVTAKIIVRWRMGVYVLPESSTAYEQASVANRADQMFLKLLRDFERQGRNVCHKLGATYAPALFG